MPNLAPYFIERTAPEIRHHYPGVNGLKDYDSAGIGLVDCWKIIKARRRLIGFLVLSAVALTTAVVFVMTPQYRAAATLMIDPETPHMMDVTTMLERLQYKEEDDYSKTQYALLQSDQLAAQVIHELGLENDPRLQSHSPLKPYAEQLTLLIDTATGRQPAIPRKARFGVSPEAIEAYSSRLRVAPGSGTRLVEVSFQTPDPELSAAIVNAHVTDYVSLASQVQAKGSETARAFLEKEAVGLEAKVEKSEAELNTYRNRMGILSFGVKDQEKNEIAEQTMVDLNKALTEAETQRIKEEAQMEQVKSGNFDSLPDVVNNLMIQNLRPQVDQLQSQYAELSAKYTDEYPPLREVKAKLQSAKGRIDTDMASIAHSVERGYKAAVAREQELQARVAREKQLDFSRNDASLQDAVLAREVETNREVYQDVLKRMQEISVNGAAPLSNISVVENADPPALPSVPQKAKTIAISLLVSAICGIGLAFLTDQLDDRLKSADEIESYLHLPQLGTVPDFSRIPGKSSTRQSLPAALSLLCNSQNSAPQSKSRSLVRARHAADVMEVYKSIRSALLYSRAGGAPRTILFMSAITGEGKTTTASGTALAFAQTGARTLLVDADLRKPRCHSILGGTNSVGLSEILVGRAEPRHAVQRLDNWRTEEYEGLFFLGAGAPVPNPGELLTSVRMYDVMQRLSNDYQFMLLDSAPIASASDTLGLATMVDGVVVVAGPTTPKQTIRGVCRRLFDAGATVFGVVVNGVDIRNSSFVDATRYYERYGEYADSPEAVLRTDLHAAEG